MLFITLFLITIIYIYNKKDLINIRKFLFTMSVIISLLLFTSTDPILHIPLYFYFMFFSIISSLKSINLAKFKFPLSFISLLIYLSLQLLLLAIGVNYPPTLLINQSNTDTLNILNELYIPKLNVTVIKHYLFFMLYLIFILLNRDLLIDRGFKNKLGTLIIVCFKLLFIFIITESIVVNLFSINDRNFMAFIFSIYPNNQLENWKTFGISSVCFCFNERSTMAIVILFYFLYLKGNINFTKFIWILVSGIAVFCTGSSSSLVLFAIALFITIIKVLFNQSLTFTYYLTLAFIFILGLIIFFRYNDILLAKIYAFLDSNVQWGSAFFRKQSIIYGLTAFFNSIFLGYGIGTVYCHSMLIQTLANIGLIGYVLTIYLHIKLLNVNITIFNTIGLLLFITFSATTFLLQQFTSPFLLAAIFSVFSNNTNKYKKNDVLKGDILCLV